MQLRFSTALRRRDFGHLDVQMTFEDATAYTRPSTIRYAQTLVPNNDVLEFVCAENEKHLKHIN